MIFYPNLVCACLLKRYKRFLADVELINGKVITVYCPNTGSMLGLNSAGNLVWLTSNNSARRKYNYALELIELDESVLVDINPVITNRLVLEAINAGLIKELLGYDTIRQEVKYENSRIDFLLEGENIIPTYLEVKSVTLSRKHGISEFPDAITLRGAKHLDILCKIKLLNMRAVLLFIVQRTDCNIFTPAGDIDLNYAKAFYKALNLGVEILCYDCQIDKKAISIRKPLKINY